MCYIIYSECHCPGNTPEILLVLIKWNSVLGLQFLVGKLGWPTANRLIAITVYCFFAINHSCLHIFSIYLDNWCSWWVKSSCFSLCNLKLVGTCSCVTVWKRLVFVDKMSGTNLLRVLYPFFTKVLENLSLFLNNQQHMQVKYTCCIHPNIRSLQ